MDRHPNCRIAHLELMRLHQTWTEMRLIGTEKQEQALPLHVRSFSLLGTRSSSTGQGIRSATNPRWYVLQLDQVLFQSGPATCRCTSRHPPLLSAKMLTPPHTTLPLSLTKGVVYPQRRPKRHPARRGVPVHLGAEEDGPQQHSPHEDEHEDHEAQSIPRAHPEEVLDHVLLTGDAKKRQTTYQ